MYWWALQSYNGLETRKYKQYHGLWPLVFSRLPCYQVNTSDDEETKDTAADANNSSHALSFQYTWHCADDLRYRSIWNHSSFLPNLESPEYLLHLPAPAQLESIIFHTLPCLCTCLFVSSFIYTVWLCVRCLKCSQTQRKKMLTQWYKMKW